MVIEAAQSYANQLLKWHEVDTAVTAVRMIQYPVDACDVGVEVEVSDVTGVLQLFLTQIEATLSLPIAPLSHLEVERPDAGSDFFVLQHAHTRSRRSDACHRKSVGCVRQDTILEPSEGCLTPWGTRLLIIELSARTLEHGYVARRVFFHELPCDRDHLAYLEMSVTMTTGCLGARRRLSLSTTIRRVSWRVHAYADSSDAMMAAISANMTIVRKTATRFVSMTTNDGT